MFWSDLIGCVFGNPQWSVKVMPVSTRVNGFVDYILIFLTSEIIPYFCQYCFVNPNSVYICARVHQRLYCIEACATSHRGLQWSLRHTRGIRIGTTGEQQFHNLTALSSSTETLETIEIKS